MKSISSLFNKFSKSFKLSSILDSGSYEEGNKSIKKNRIFSSPSSLMNAKNFLSGTKF